jgi:hypothetical protein
MTDEEELLDDATGDGTHQADDKKSTERPAFRKRPQTALSKLRRELSDEELQNSGVQKMLLDSLDRLEHETAQLQSFERKYHDVARKLAVAEEKLIRSNWVQALEGIGLTIGGLFVGISLPLQDATGFEKYGTACFYGGLLLFLLAAACRLYGALRRDSHA